MYVTFAEVRLLLSLRPPVSLASCEALVSPYLAACEPPTLGMHPTDSHAHLGDAGSPQAVHVNSIVIL